LKSFDQKNKTFKVKQHTVKVDWNQGRITHQDTMKADGLLAILQKDRKGIIESFVEDFKTMFDYDGFRGDFDV